MNNKKTPKQSLEELANPGKAEILRKFFKTGKGQYGEGDLFIGITVPKIRQVAKEHPLCTLEEIEKLLNDPIHECRMLALFLLEQGFKKEKDQNTKEQTISLYLRNTTKINNWDLVDLSAPKILGEHLIHKPLKESLAFLEKMAESTLLWDQRIAILCTFPYIRKKEFLPILTLSEKLVNHPHDLMQKAIGWMLREMGKRDLIPLRKFLEKHHKTMPRTMLRYAIEKMDSQERALWMKKEQTY